MEDIIEATGIIRYPDDKKGLSTKLIFDEPMEIDGHRICALRIETCNTPQFGNNFYQNTVSNMAGDEESSFILESQQCNKDNYAKTHIDKVNEYKQRYLKRVLSMGDK